MHESCTFLMFLYKKNTGLLTILPESCTFLMFLSNFSILSKYRHCYSYNQEDFVLIFISCPNFVVFCAHYQHALFPRILG